MNKIQKYYPILKRGLLIFGVSIFLLFYLFSPFEFPLKSTENSTVIRVSEEEIFKPSLKTTLRDILEVPFELKWYDICFVNNDTKLIYENGTIDNNVNVTLKFNNLTEYNISYGKTKCITYKFNKNFTYKWSLDFGMYVSSSDIEKIKKTKGIFHFAKLHPDIHVNAYIKPRDLIVKYLLLLFAWSGLLFLWFNILDYIKFGRKNK